MTQSANATPSMMRHRPPFLTTLALIWMLVMLVFPVKLSARTEEYQELTFTRLALSADQQRMALTDIVHLTIFAHVKEHIGRLDHVVLPNLTGFQTEGDEHHVSETASGTDYTEVLTLSPERLGTFTLGPVRVEAINHLTQTPSAFLSSSVTISVVAFDPSEPIFHRLIRTAGILIMAMIIGLVVFHFGRMGFSSLIDLLLGRKPRSVARVERVLEAPPVAEPRGVPRAKSRLEHLRQVVEMARRNPDRQRALELRIALRDAFGAGPDETLSDVTARLPDGERGLLARALRAAERAAFINEEARTTAIEESLILMEAACVRLEGEA